MNGGQYDYLLEALGFCCISRESLAEIVRIAELIDNRNDPKFERSNYYTDLATQTSLSPLHVELILEVLDRKELSEHGTSVRGSWLTEKGERFLDGYKQLEKLKMREETE